MMTYGTILKILAWLCLAAILFVTVSPIELRPHDTLPVDIDRALAFALMAGLFVLSYPRSFVLCAILLILGAGAIELLQNFSPGRHAHLDDAAVKAFGAAIGAIAGWLVNRVRLTMTARSVG